MRKFLQKIGLLKAKKHHCIYRQIRIGVYEVKLHILVADDYHKIWHSLFPQITWTPGKYAVGSFLFADGEGYVAVRKDATVGTIAHEAAHIAHQVMRYVGIKHSRSNDEAECYLVSSISDEIDHTMRHVDAKLHSSVPC